MKPINYRSTFWLKRKHAARKRRWDLNPMITHAMLMRWKPAQRRMGRGTRWFFAALFGVERWWEFRQWDNELFLHTLSDETSEKLRTWTRPRAWHESD